MNPKAKTVNAYEKIGPMTSLMLIDIMDDFCSLLTESVVIVLDKTPIHVSNVIKERREYLEKRGLALYFFRDSRQN